MSQMSKAGAVVMAVHRPDPALLERQVRSLQRQELADWVCVVGIDGRDEGAHGLLTELVAGDERFALHHFDENVGVYRHFERLLELLPLDDVGWVALADHDDEWQPMKLSLLVDALDDPAVTAVVGRARVVAEGQDGGLTERHVGGFASTLLVNQVTGSLAVFRADVVAGALPFPPGNAHAIHDHWLAVCASARGSVVQLGSVVQDYVQHGANVIGESGHHTPRDAMEALRSAGGPLRMVDSAVGGRWAWRVQMARTTRERVLPAGERELVEAVARGRLAPVIAIAVIHGIRRREITVLEGVALLAAAARWSRVGPVKAG